MIIVDDFSTPRLNMAETMKVFLFYWEPSWVKNIPYIEQLLNEAEYDYDVKNYADRGGAIIAIDWVLPTSASKYGNHWWATDHESIWSVW